MATKQDVVLNVRSTIASYIMYWHKMCLEISILVSSGIIAVSTFGVDRAALSLPVKACLIAAFLIASLASVWLIVKISTLVQELREILVRLDQHDQLFIDGAYIPGKSIYPKTWESFDAVRMDIIPKWSIGLLLSTGLAVSLILLFS